MLFIRTSSVKTRLVTRLAWYGLRSSYRRCTALLDRRVFPAIVAYASHPITIVATILLLIPLIVFANATALVLLGNTYLNICSAAVSSIVLAQSLKHHHEVKRLHAQHSEQLTALHSRMTTLEAQQFARQQQPQQQVVSESSSVPPSPPGPPQAPIPTKVTPPKTAIQPTSEGQASSCR